MFLRVWFGVGLEGVEGIVLGAEEMGEGGTYGLGIGARSLGTLSTRPPLGLGF